jgi:hypothetical protein
MNATEPLIYKILLHGCLSYRAHHQATDMTRVSNHQALWTDLGGSVSRVWAICKGSGKKLCNEGFFAV